MMKAHWEHFHHEADIGVRGIGSTPEMAFEQAAMAVTAVITDLEKVAPDKQIQISCQAPDMELLFADWLNALIYEMATRQMLFRRFEVKLEKTQLRARVWGEPVEVEKHHPAVEIKGATYTELKVCKSSEGGWLAQCVVDV